MSRVCQRSRWFRRPIPFARECARLVVVGLGLGLGLLSGSPASVAAPVTGHPRLLMRAEDLPALRARMIPGNDAWVAFKEQVVDPCLRDWKCSATQVWDPVNYQWIRTSFTDEFGVLHQPGDADWSQYSYQLGRPAAPEDDMGESSGNVRLHSEQYAMVFAFMARLLEGVPGQEVQRAEYVAAAKECLFKVIDQAQLGPADGQPWRQPGFATDDRSFAAESFPLTVDWIYEDLTAHELAKVRSAFLHWSRACNEHVYFAPRSPHGPQNSPSLLRLGEPDQAIGRDEIRLALNNHYANHEREMVLFGLSLDPKDDVPSAFLDVTDAAPAGALTSHTVSPGQPDAWVRQSTGVLADTLGVWLYLTDYALRHDGAGGISVEGTQYASNGLGPVALLMHALHTAGQDDPAVWGPQVSLADHPFWSRTVPAYLAQLTPTPRVPAAETGFQYLGPIFQPPLTGDLETFLYVNNQFIKVLAPIALHDASVHGTTGDVVQAVRYIQRDLAPGGPSAFVNRIASLRSNKTLRDGIYLFLLYDPAAPAAADPRPAQQPKTFYSSHVVDGREMGMVIARTGYSPADTCFYTHLDWNRIDHQRGDSMGFGFWKNGLWLTKPMTGYGPLQGASDYRNALSLGNGVPTSSPVSESLLAQHGSQWIYSPIGDPQIRARSFASGYLYTDQDATPLYQHRWQTQLREVTHASRRILWLKPDVLVIHDVARSKQSGYFKRFYLNTPEPAIVDGNVAHATARDGSTAKAELFVTQLLPAGATMQTNSIATGEPAGGEDLKARLFTEAPGHPQEAHFLHVVEGTDVGVASATPASTLASSAGPGFEGCVVGDVAVLFRQDPDGSGDAITYALPATVARHYVTGLAKSAGFDVNQVTVAGQTTISLVPGGTQRYSDSGGVLVLGASEPATVELSVTDAAGSETGPDAVTFQFQRSGDLSAPLTVNFDHAGTAAAADFAGAPTSVTFAAGSPTALLVLTPVDDVAFENDEEVRLRVVDGAGYAASEVFAEASASVTDNDAPPGGYLAFSAVTFTANEAGGQAQIAVQRTGGSSGAVGATVSAAGLLPAGVTVSWGDGETADQVATFQVTDDAVWTGDRTVAVSLGGATGGAAVGNPKSATLTILDDEPAPPGQITFDFASTNVTEAAGAFTIQVRRVNGKGGATSATITAGGTATAGTDFTVSPATLTWADNENASKTVTVTVLQDNAYEGPGENATLTLGITSGGATVGAIGTLSVQVAEDDPEPQEYDVGDGFPYATIGSVPWKQLGPGAVVRIHHRAAAYHEKILLSTRGSAAEPIQVIGVAGPNGEKPVIDGEDATSSASLGYESWSYTPQLGIVAIARGNNTPPGDKPGHVEIRGLAIRHSTDLNYLDGTGTPAPYWSSGGALYLRGAEHVVIRDCEFDHAPNGVVIENYDTELEVTRDVLLERCVFHDNAKAGSYSGNNLQSEAIGLTVQFCRFEPTLNRNLVSNIRDRSAGATFRYNWIEGGSPLLELIEPTGAPGLVTSDAGFGATYVHGNALVTRSADTSGTARFGASYYGDMALARPLLHFHSNTVLLDNASTSLAVFSLPLAGTTVEARNNAFHATSGQFHFLSTAGVVNLGVNWARTGWSAGSAGTVNGTGLLVSGTDPGFADLAAADLHPTLVSVLRNAAGAPASGAPVIDHQYLAVARGESRMSPVDLGAFGYSTPSAVDDEVHFLPRRSVKFTISSLLSNDSSPLGNPLSFVEVGAASAHGGTVQRVGASLLYRPPDGYAGDDSVAYVISDGARQANGTVQLVMDAEPGTLTRNILSTQVVDVGGGLTEVHLSVAGIPGRTYWLQITDSLIAPVSWSNLGSAQSASAAGRLSFVDPTPASPRFYRVIEATAP